MNPNFSNAKTPRLGGTVKLCLAVARETQNSQLETIFCVIEFFILHPVYPVDPVKDYLPSV